MRMRSTLYVMQIERLKARTHTHAYSQPRTHTHIYFTSFIKKQTACRLYFYLFLQYLKYFFFYFRLVFERTLHISKHFRVSKQYPKNFCRQFNFIFLISRFAYWLLSRFAYSPGNVCLAFLLHFFLN